MFSSTNPFPKESTGDSLPWICSLDVPTVQRCQINTWRWFDMCHGGAELSADPSWHMDCSVPVSSVPGKEQILHRGDKKVMQEQQWSMQMTRHGSWIKDESSREKLHLGMSLLQPLSQVSKNIFVYPLYWMSSFWGETQRKLKSWLLSLERGQISLSRRNLEGKK